MAKKQLSESIDSSLKLFLRIKHPSIDPREITKALALEPEHQVRAGTDESGTGVRRLHTESYWLALLKMESRDEFVKWIRERSQQEKTVLTPDITMEMLKAFKGVTSMFEVRLIRALNRLTESSGFLAQLVGDGGSVTLLVQKSDSQEAISFSPTLMRSLADLSVTVEID